MDDIIAFMKVGDFMSNFDITNAFRIVAIHPQDRIRQELCWNFNNTPLGVNLHGI